MVIRIKKRFKQDGDYGMTGKRFIIIGEENLEFIMQDKLLLPIYDDKERLSLKTCCDLLNELHEENQRFREALKELKTIGDYQAMRIKELNDMNSLIEDEIDKKIAVLTDAKIKSFQNDDGELFGKIQFSIQVLRELKEVILE